MDIHSRQIKIYRWIVFLLAAGYTLNKLFTGDYSEPGGPFRFLTHWALFLSFFSASRMLALSERRTDTLHEITAMCASVLNTMVVFLYWKLYLTDPALVNGNGPLVWYQEYYLHGLGPALQIIDALFIARAFKRPLRAVPVLLSIILTYVLFSELFVQRFNDTPLGSVTSGLPYPFLNSMVFGERAGFYGFNAAVSLAILLAFAGIAWAINRVIFRPVSAER
jgi:hypothetical protein